MAGLLGDMSHPVVREMLDYLSSRGVVPTFNSRFIRDGVNGSTTGSEVTISPDAGPSTLPHELSHVATNEMTKQRFDGTGSPQFIDAWNKLAGTGRTQTLLEWLMEKPNSGPQYEARRTMAERLGAKNHNLSDYRLSGTELSAFGIGNSAYPKDAVNKGLLHLDPTMATEQLILLELAKRKRAK